MIFLLNESVASEATGGYTAEEPVRFTATLAACLATQAAPQLCSSHACKSASGTSLDELYTVGCFVNAEAWLAVDGDAKVACSQLARQWELEWWWLPSLRRWLPSSLASDLVGIQQHRTGDGRSRGTASASVKASASVRITATLSVGLKSQVGTVRSTPFNVGGMQYSDISMSYGPQAKHKYDSPQPPAPSDSVGSPPGMQILVAPEVATWVTVPEQCVCLACDVAACTVPDQRC